MQSLSNLEYIDKIPKKPLELFLSLLKPKTVESKSPILMGIATADEEYGVLNRTVVYRDLTDNHITFVTEKNSRKYDNIKKNPKVAVTYVPGVVLGKFWQIRMCGEAKELNPDLISALWKEEPVFAKIRSRICECGKPVDHAQLKQAHDALLEAYNSGKDILPQTETYTAFKIVPVMWDFYASKVNYIADRVQYKRDDSQEDKWNFVHVAA